MKEKERKKDKTIPKDRQIGKQTWKNTFPPPTVTETLNHM